jgi:hypothetical protein
MIESRDDAAVDWLLACAALGWQWANCLEDRRLRMVEEGETDATITAALAVELIEDCDLAGVTYYREGAFYFVARDWSGVSA